MTSRSINDSNAVCPKPKVDASFSSVDSRLGWGSTRGFYTAKVLPWASSRLSTTSTRVTVACTLLVCLAFQLTWLSWSAAVSYRVAHSPLQLDEFGRPVLSRLQRSALDEIHHHFSSRLGMTDQSGGSAASGSRSSRGSSQLLDGRAGNAAASIASSSAMFTHAKRNHLRPGRVRGINIGEAGTFLEGESRASLQQASVALERDKRLAARIGCAWVRGPRALDLELEARYSKASNGLWNQRPLTSTVESFKNKGVAAGHKSDDGLTIVLHDWIGETMAWSPKHQDGKLLG